MRTMVDIVQIRAMSLFLPQEAVPCKYAARVDISTSAPASVFALSGQPAWMVEIKSPRAMSPS